VAACSYPGLGSGIGDPSTDPFGNRSTAPPENWLGRLSWRSPGPCIVSQGNPLLYALSHNHHSGLSAHRCKPGTMLALPILCDGHLPRTSLVPEYTLRNLPHECMNRAKRLNILVPEGSSLILTAHRPADYDSAPSLWTAADHADITILLFPRSPRVFFLRYIQTRTSMGREQSTCFCPRQSSEEEDLS